MTLLFKLPVASAGSSAEGVDSFAREVAPQITNLAASSAAKCKSTGELVAEVALGHLVGGATVGTKSGTFDSMPTSYRHAIFKIHLSDRSS